MENYDKINSLSLSLKPDGCGGWMRMVYDVEFDCSSTCGAEEVWWLVLKGFVGILVFLLLRSCCDTIGYGVQHVQERFGEFQE
jgi:hypothetical protein